MTRWGEVEDTSSESASDKKKLPHLCILLSVEGETDRHFCAHSYYWVSCVMWEQSDRDQEIVCTVLEESGSSLGFAVLSFQCQNSAKQRKQWASKCFQIAKTEEKSEHSFPVSLTWSYMCTRPVLLFSFGLVHLRRRLGLIPAWMRWKGTRLGL